MFAVSQSQRERSLHMHQVQGQDTLRTDAVTTTKADRTVLMTDQEHEVDERGLRERASSGACDGGNDGGRQDRRHAQTSALRKSAPRNDLQTAQRTLQEDAARNEGTQSTAKSKVDCAADLVVGRRSASRAGGLTE